MVSLVVKNSLVGNELFANLESCNMYIWNRLTVRISKHNWCPKTSFPICYSLQSSTVSFSGLHEKSRKLYQRCKKRKLFFLIFFLEKFIFGKQKD